MLTPRKTRPRSAAVEEIHRLETVVHAKCRANFPPHRWRKDLPGCPRGHRITFRMVYGWQGAVAVANAGRVYRYCLKEEGKPQPLCGIAYLYKPPAGLYKQLHALLKRRQYLKTIRSREYRRRVKEGTLPEIAEVPYPWEALNEVRPPGQPSPGGQTKFCIVWYHADAARAKIFTCETKITPLYTLEDFPEIMETFGPASGDPRAVHGYEFLHPRTLEWRHRTNWAYPMKVRPGSIYTYRSPGVTICGGLDSPAKKIHTGEAIAFSSSPPSLDPSSNSQPPSSLLAAVTRRRKQALAKASPSGAVSNQSKNSSGLVGLEEEVKPGPNTPGLSNNRSRTPAQPHKTVKRKYLLPSPNRAHAPFLLEKLRAQSQNLRKGKGHARPHILMGELGSATNPIVVDNE